MACPIAAMLIHQPMIIDSGLSAGPWRRLLSGRPSTSLVRSSCAKRSWLEKRQTRQRSVCLCAPVAACRPFLAAMLYMRPVAILTARGCLGQSPVHPLKDRCSPADAAQVSQHALLNFVTGVAAFDQAQEIANLVKSETYPRLRQTKASRFGLSPV
jgi:hypothetical protein